ncbi:MAG TPA: hypothetical protein VHC18_12885 [Amycolatopsis sp.]|nr:hypothetical protein [Amycolatopsis sp.]
MVVPVPVPVAPEVPPVLDVVSWVVVLVVVEDDVGAEDDEELDDDGGDVDEDVLGGCESVLVVGGSSRELVGVVVVVPGGSWVPGGTYTSPGIGVPGGSTYGAADEPAAGTMVTTGCPSGPTVTTAVGWVARGTATPLTLTASCPGTGLPAMTCGPDAVLVLPACRSAALCEDGDASVASPPNAVASTTPLTASMTYPLRFDRDDGSRGGDTAVR